VLALGELQALRPPVYQTVDPGNLQAPASRLTSTSNKVQWRHCSDETAVRGSTWTTPSPTWSRSWLVERLAREETASARSEQDLLDSSASAARDNVSHSPRSSTKDERDREIADAYIATTSIDSSTQQKLRHVLVVSC